MLDLRILRPALQPDVPARSTLAALCRSGLFSLPT
jgi:hypothetical protein